MVNVDDDIIMESFGLTITSSSSGGEDVAVVTSSSDDDEVSKSDRVLRPRGHRMSYSEPEYYQEALSNRSSPSSQDDSSSSESSSGSDSEDADDITDENSLFMSSEIMIGKEFQAVLPKMLTDFEKEEYSKKADPFCMWKPTESLSEEMLDGFLERADKVTFGSGKRYNQDQYLGMLYHCKYNVNIALKQLKDNRSRDFEKTAWPRAEKKRFDRAFDVCGKDFTMIRRWFPEKSFKSIVQYYYERKVFLKKSAGSAANKVRNAKNSASSSPRSCNGNGRTTSFLSKPAFRRMPSTESQGKDCKPEKHIVTID